MSLFAALGRTGCACCYRRRSSRRSSWSTSAGVGWVKCQFHLPLQALSGPPGMMCAAARGSWQRLCSQVSKGCRESSPARVQSW